MSIRTAVKATKPKVAASTSGSVVGTVVAYYLDKLPFVHNAPPVVEGGVVVLVVGVITWAAGYLKREAK